MSVLDEHEVLFCTFIGRIAGINIVYIRDYLGHEDISTTMIYLKNSYRLKDQAMSKLIPKITEHSVYPDWSKDQSLMEFLNSFQ